ncbi:prolyl oligopeptidase family serine peptidase [Pseudobacter ginsenosidimutans]|uniref:Dipeptidyl aminopeptidase/acylaminoacyl peptidase n=1 Tax=Pseudobacter ginsenosidimutans TaxID=661488 RepID=A0A4Q7MCX7_9BACT|nr:prolyl oligopeptidase family serine peptidase [Pseudobacter ginsenosidimutans]QEC42666.1 prolyl oligopeptidase family serine peptidase [Pseudobacter ginsenosidimutans]RZS65183.1 dipeptidyl aminopeptidase/acylaminoacyl peptidase [Pseudobacter ginsenosidimutans]
MRKHAYAFLLLLTAASVKAQSPLTPLTVDKIMRDPKWIGSSPSSLNWSADGKILRFLWNPDKAASDSAWIITPANLKPQKMGWDAGRSQPDPNSIQYNSKYTAYVYTNRGDIYLTELKTGTTKRITETIDTESSPVFSFNETRIVFNRGGNLYSWEMSTGAIAQLTNFQQGSAPKAGSGGAGKSVQEKWLETESLANSAILRERKEKKEQSDSMAKTYPKIKTLRTLFTEDKSAGGLQISADGRFIAYRLFRSNNSGKGTIIPNYVTESGFTEDIRGRTKVGTPSGISEFYVFDSGADTVFAIKTDSLLPGIKDIPAFYKDYPAVYAQKSKNPAARSVSIQGSSWSPNSQFALLDLRSNDNKDRWLVLVDGATGKITPLDRQHDEAWIAGPGIQGFGGGNTGWIDNNTIWFQSEATGYSHLYTLDVRTQQKKALTSGNYEVQSADLSRNKKYFYISTNQVHPGEQHYYRLPVAGGKAEQLTSLTGSNQVSISPDEKWLAYLYSYSNKPWELYIQENKAGAKPQQVTNLARSAEFASYNWRDPELITFPATDGANVYARLYRPANPHPSKPAVIFVHGAGYLQNVHKWWSSYFREYMFHNLLADNGYTVLDIDYRGSAGYGRDWRTGIYRHMGGKDLSDQVDGAKYLVDKLGVNATNIGIYGGSYGGFITLMALFTQPGVFNAGAALRSVTDWAHYNHGYTSNILNEPATDSIAYYRSSPINFAAGLKDNLLMCHGMVDVNVHFQDIVRLSQKLIELGKDKWELAVYPVEDHGFVEPSSWTDEYKRIFHLFETHLKK